MKSIKAESINRNRSRWFITRSIDMARRYSKEINPHRTIYELPNGAYAVRKIKGVPIKD